MPQIIAVNITGVQYGWNYRLLRKKRQNCKPGACFYVGRNSLSIDRYDLFLPQKCGNCVYSRIFYCVFFPDFYTWLLGSCAEQYCRQTEIIHAARYLKRCNWRFWKEQTGNSCVMSLSCETKELNMTEESLPTLFRLWLIDTRELFKTYIEKNS